MVNQRLKLWKLNVQRRLSDCVKRQYAMMKTCEWDLLIHIHLDDLIILCSSWNLKRVHELLTIWPDTSYVRMHEIWQSSVQRWLQQHEWAELLMSFCPSPIGRFIFTTLSFHSTFTTAVQLCNKVQPYTLLQSFVHCSRRLSHFYLPRCSTSSRYGSVKSRLTLKMYPFQYSSMCPLQVSRAETSRCKP